MRQIVLDKSIQKQRLVFKVNTELILDYIFMYLLAYVLPVISVKIIFFPSKYNLQHWSPRLNFIMLIIDVWLLLSLYLTNKLIDFKGISFDLNKETIIKVLKSKYPKFELSENVNVIKAGWKVTNWNRGKLITVILDNDCLYINMLSTYRGGQFSYFNGLANYFRCRSIIKSFKLAQQNYSHGNNT
jgi:hypothetical protein